MSLIPFGSKQDWLATCKFFGGHPKKRCVPSQDKRLSNLNKKAAQQFSSEGLAVVKFLPAEKRNFF